MTDTTFIPPARQAIADAVLIPLALIKPNPWNRKPSEKGLAELADTVRRHGVMQPVLVRQAEGAKPDEPLYELIAGERRWRASEMAGRSEIPALVRPMDDLEVIELMLIENLQREGLHELDEAAGYDRLLRKDSGAQSLRGFATVDELADRLGKSRSYVVQRLTLLKLCPEGVKAFRSGELSFSLALRIARLPNHADQARATREILQGWGGNPMSARDADAYIHRTFMLELDRAAFKITDATLVPEAGSCRDCAKRAGANAGLFDDIKKGDTCTDGACFARKEDAHRQRVKDEAHSRGLEVLAGAAARKIKPQQHGRPSGLLALDEVHYQIDGKKTLRQLLKKADVKPVLFEDPHSKALVEMVPETQALAALKDAGVLRQAKLPSTSSAQRQDEQRRKAEAEWRTAVAEACLNGAGGDAGGAPEYRQRLIQRVAVTLWHELQNDTRVRMIKLLGWPPLKSRWDKGAGVTADEHIQGLDDAQLCRYFTCAVIAGESRVAGYETIGKPERLLSVADELGVDVVAIKASLRKPVRVAKPAKRGRGGAAGDANQATPETALAAALKRATAAKGAKPEGRAVKYRNASTGETWSGRGLQPKWLKAALAGGAALADFEVRASAAVQQLSAAGAANGIEDLVGAPA